jgi:hypothetical protein
MTVLGPGQQEVRLMGNSAQPENERYNPWSVVNLVFHHLVDEGLHPILGDAGNPGAPAAALLIALGIEPATEGSRKATEQIRTQLDELRAAAFGEDETSPNGGDPDSAGLLPAGLPAVSS